MSGSVSNKVVIVTGSARGIGAGIAADLAEKGAHVVIADLNADAARATAFENIRSWRQCDRGCRGCRQPQKRQSVDR